MSQPNDLSRSLVALDQDSTIIAVFEMSQSSWLVGGVLPGIERQPRKKQEPSPERLRELCRIKMVMNSRWSGSTFRASRSRTANNPKNNLIRSASARPVSFTSSTKALSLAHRTCSTIATSNAFE